MHADEIPTTHAPPPPVLTSTSRMTSVTSMARTAQSTTEEYMLMKPGSQDYMVMKPGAQVTKPEDSYLVMGTKPSASNQYMLMQPATTLQGQEDGDGEIFCAVELPPKRSNSGGSSREMLCSHNGSFSSASSTDPLCREDQSYLDMSVAKGQSNQTFAQSSSVSNMPEMCPQLRPHLSHSKSWDNELDSDFLRKSESGSSSPYMQMSQVTPADTTVAASANYMSMSLCSSTSNADNKTSCETKPWKPFENLIEHQHHLNRIAELPPRPPVQPAEEDSKASNGNSNGTSGKSPGLLSRLMRRGSTTKERKISRSQEDILADSPPEVPPRSSDSFTGSPRVQRQHSMQYPRRHSTDILDTKPDRQRSMSFQGRSWLDQGINLTDEQKQTCASLLEVVPPPPTRAEFVPTTMAPMAPPLPPKSYHSNQKPNGSNTIPRSAFSNPGSRSSSHSKLSLLSSSSETPFHSDCTLSTIHVSGDENNDGSVDSEDEKPPDLPPKSAQLRNRGSAVFDPGLGGHRYPPPVTMQAEPAGCQEAKALAPTQPMASVSPGVARSRRMPPNLTVNIPEMCEEEEDLPGASGLWMHGLSGRLYSIWRQLLC